MTKQEALDVYKIIEEYKSIVIVGHINPDPDCMSSTIAFRNILNNMFSDKNIYAVGTPVAKFKFLGNLDKLPDNTKNSLLIILDTPNIVRVDIPDIQEFDKIIKIDHHPFIETIGDIEIIDSTAAATAQMILEFSFLLNLKIDTDTAKILYQGIVSDTNRFMYDYTSVKTFSLVTRLLEETNIDFTNLYDDLYMQTPEFIKLLGYVYINMTYDKSGFAHIYLSEKLLKEIINESTSIGNIINYISNIEGIYAWAIFVEDSKNDIIKCSIRSRGPIINKIAEDYNGGGHIYASGIRLHETDKLDEIIDRYKNLCIDYKNELGE